MSDVIDQLDVMNDSNKVSQRARPKATMPVAVAKTQRTNVSIFFEKLNFKQTADKHKLARKWNYRNTDHGEIFATSLEVDYIAFQQNLFIQDSKEISAKLTRIGFVNQDEYPGKQFFETFTRVMYHPKHNIAVSLYQPRHKEAITMASQIASKSVADPQTAIVVFLAAVDVILNK